MADDEEDIVKTETAKLKAKIEELQNAVSESEAAAKAAQTDSERISALLQAYELSIDLVGYTIMITDFAYPITKVKNESWLTEGRKVCLRAIIIMEELVTGFVETDFASVEEKLLPLEEVIDDDEKWRLVRKTGFAISTFCDSFMENSKWKWILVEIRARFAVIVKNLINYKTFTALNVPNQPGYESRFYLVETAKKLMQEAADNYREKYEIAGQNISDINTAIHYLSALRQIHVYLGESVPAEDVKKRIEVWTAKMKDDSRS